MITYLHSATLLVRDQDAALDFYVNTLGFEVRQDRPFGDESRWLVVAPPGATTGVALLLPSDVGVPAEMAGTYSGLSWIADDVQGTYDALVAKGVQFTQPPERMPWGALATWFADPDGNSFFLTEDVAG